MQRTVRMTFSSFPLIDPLPEETAVSDFRTSTDVQALKSTNIAKLPTMCFIRKTHSSSLNLQYVPDTNT